MIFNSETDKVKFVENITCKICIEIYDSRDDRRPCNLPCGHTFCRECILKLKNGACLECPLDRKMFKGNIDQIAVNYDLLSIAAFYRQFNIEINEESLSLDREDSIDFNHHKTCTLKRQSQSQNFGFCLKKMGNKFIIGEIIADSIAFKAGLRDDDCLVDINGVRILDSFIYEKIDELIRENTNEIFMIVSRVPGYKYDEIFYRVVEFPGEEKKVGISLERTDRGLYVESVESDSLGQLAGFKVGEIICEINGIDVAKSSPLEALVIIRRSVKMAVFAVKS